MLHRAPRPCIEQRGPLNAAPFRDTHGFERIGPVLHEKGRGPVNVLHPTCAFNSSSMGRRPAPRSACVTERLDEAALLDEGALEMGAGFSGSAEAY
ncbi:hypothetical protein MHYP_G00228820 [Metynnis hypsauchen]